MIVAQFSIFKERLYLFTIGPHLPFPLWGSSMITSPNCNGVVLIGGYNSKDGIELNQLIELKGDSMIWIFLEQTLMYARKRHIAISV